MSGEAHFRTQYQKNTLRIKKPCTGGRSSADRRERGRKRLVFFGGKACSDFVSRGGGGKPKREGGGGAVAGRKRGLSHTV